MRDAFTSMAALTVILILLSVSSESLGAEEISIDQLRAHLAIDGIKNSLGDYALQVTVMDKDSETSSRLHQMLQREAIPERITTYFFGNTQSDVTYEPLTGGVGTTKAPGSPAVVTAASIDLGYSFSQSRGGDPNFKANWIQSDLDGSLRLSADDQGKFGGIYELASPGAFHRDEAKVFHTMSENEATALVAKFLNEIVAIKTLKSHLHSHLLVYDTRTQTFYGLFSPLRTEVDISTEDRRNSFLLVERRPNQKAFSVSMAGALFPADVMSGDRHYSDNMLIVPLGKEEYLAIPNLYAKHGVGYQEVFSKFFPKIPDLNRLPTPFIANKKTNKYRALLPIVNSVEMLRAGLGRDFGPLVSSNRFIEAYEQSLPAKARNLNEGREMLKKLSCSRLF